MNVSLYQAAAAMDGSLRRQDVIADNLAASGISGFKRSQVGFHSVNAEMFSKALDSVNKTELQYMLPRVTGYINFDQGSLMPSGDNNSLSIDGPGFFGVNSPEGTVYTRNGSFLINKDGIMVTTEGYPLRTAGGGTITVDTNNATPITIDRNGNVSQGGGPLGQLEVVTFDADDLKNLQRLNAGFFKAGTATPLPIDPQNTRIAQGFLESSNTKPTQEMGELMTSLRHFEANQRIMKVHDENMGKLIQQLGTTQ